MTKKIIIAFVVASLMISQSFAQGYKDSIQIKNEISFSTAPILYSMIIGDEKYYNNYNSLNFNSQIGRKNLGRVTKNTFRLMYKYNFNRSSLRAGVNYDWRSESTSGYNPFYTYYQGYIYGINNGLPFMYPDSTTIITDTTRSYLNYILSSSQNWGVNLGYEYTFGKKRLKGFFGIDIVGYKYPIYQFTQRQEEKKDTVAGNPNYYTWITTSNPWFAFGNKSNLYKIGVEPFYGIKYSFTNKFYLSIQSGFEVFYAIGKIKFADEKGDTYTQKVNEFHFYKQSFVTDISLTYKFGKISLKKKSNREDKSVSESQDTLKYKNIILKTDIFLPVILGSFGIKENSISVEKGFQNRHAIQVTGMFSYYNENRYENYYGYGTNWNYSLFQICTDYKYYLSNRKSYCGFYSGVFANEIMVRENLYEGFQYLQFAGGGGAIIGYQNYINKRWVVDFTFGLGVLCLEGTKILKDDGNGTYNYLYFMPTEPNGRVGINVGYRF